MLNIEQLFQMFNNPGVNVRQKQTKIIIPHDFLVTEMQFNSYSNEIKAIYEQVFVLPSDTEENTSKEIHLESKMMFQRKKTPMPICNKILTANEPGILYSYFQYSDATIACLTSHQFYVKSASRMVIIRDTDTARYRLEEVIATAVIQMPLNQSDFVWIIPEKLNLLSQMRSKSSILWKQSRLFQSGFSDYMRNRNKKARIYLASSWQTFCSK